MVTVRQRDMSGAGVSGVTSGRCLSRGGRGSRRAGGIKSPATPQHPVDGLTMQPCQECRSPIGIDAKALQCDCCKDNWKCIDCIGISPTVYEQLVAGAGGDLKWLCRLCEEGMNRYSSSSSVESNSNASMDRILSMLEKILERQESIEHKLVDKCDKEMAIELAAKTKELQENLLKIETNYGTRLEKLEQRCNEMNHVEIADFDRRIKTVEERTEVQTIMSEVINGNALKEKFEEELVQSKVDKIVSQKLDQDKDSEQRKSNIIVFGFKEEDEVSNRLQSDTDMIHRLYKDLTGKDLQTSSVTKIFRLGRRELNGKERPLMISFDSTDTKSLLMSNLTKLKEIRQKFGNISVTHDLSPRQREEVKRVLNEASVQYGGLRGSDGQENWKVIVVGQRSKPRAIRIKTAQDSCHVST